MPVWEPCAIKYFTEQPVPYPFAPSFPPSSLYAHIPGSWNNHIAQITDVEDYLALAAIGGPSDNLQGVTSRLWLLFAIFGRRVVDAAAAASARALQPEED